MSITDFPTKKRIPDGDFCGKCAWTCTRMQARCSQWEKHEAPVNEREEAIHKDIAEIERILAVSLDEERHTPPGEGSQGVSWQEPIVLRMLPASAQSLLDFIRSNRKATP